MFRTVISVHRLGERPHVYYGNGVRKLGADDVFGELAGIQDMPELEQKLREIGMGREDNFHVASLWEIDEFVEVAFDVGGKRLAYYRRLGEMGW